MTTIEDWLTTLVEDFTWDSLRCESDWRSFRLLWLPNGSRGIKNGNVDVRNEILVVGVVVTETVIETETGIGIAIRIVIGIVTEIEIETGIEIATEKGGVIVTDVVEVVAVTAIVDDDEAVAETVVAAETEVVNAHVATETEVTVATVVVTEVVIVVVNVRETGVGVGTDRVNVDHGTGLGTERGHVIKVGGKTVEAGVPRIKETRSHL